MYAEPVKERIVALLAPDRRNLLNKLLKGGWDPASIASYLGTDVITVKRVRKIMKTAEELDRATMKRLLDQDK